MRKIKPFGQIGQEGQLASRGMVRIAAAIVSDVWRLAYCEWLAQLAPRSYPQFDSHVK
jgi:hypothetical protein